MCFEFDFLAVVDDGSLDHGTGNRGYGSYHLSTRDGRKPTIRLGLGTTTNNEAESCPPT
jgi:ribonuclease HI